MKIKREQLLKQLMAVVPGLSQRDVVEQSGHFAFKGGQVMTYNDEVACVGKTDLDLEGAVPSGELLGLLRKMTEDEVEVTVADGELLIEGKKRKAGIRMDAEIALPLDAVEKPGKWSKLPEGFWDVLSIAAQCASRDESQFILTYIHLTPTCVESCDRFQIVRCPIEIGLDNVLLRASSIKSLVGMDLVGASGTESWVHFRNKLGLILSCRKYEGQYPDLADFVKVKGQRTKLPKEIGEAVSRAEVFSAAEKDDNVLQVELRPGKMRLTGRGPNGWYSETSSINYEGEQTRFTIAPKMLLDICKKADECTIGDGRIKVETDKFTYVSCVGKVEEKD